MTWSPNVRKTKYLQIVRIITHARLPCCRSSTQYTDCCCERPSTMSLPTVLFSSSIGEGSRIRRTETANCGTESNTKDNTVHTHTRLLLLLPLDNKGPNITRSAHPRLLLEDLTHSLVHWEVVPSVLSARSIVGILMQIHTSHSFI